MPLTLTLNGESRSLDDLAPGASVSDLLAALGLAGTPVLVELNGTALLPAAFDGSELGEGDSVEVIRIVAGG